MTGVFGALPFRAHAEAEEADAERAATWTCARCASARGRSGGSSRAARRRARTAAGLERDRAAAGQVGKPDDVRPVLIGSQPSRPCIPPAARGYRPAPHRGPAVPFLCEAEFLVLGADAPLRLWLAAASSIAATSWSRNSIGVGSTTSRAIAGFRRKARDLTQGARKGKCDVAHCRIETQMGSADAARRLTGSRRSPPRRCRPR